MNVTQCQAGGTAVIREKYDFTPSDSDRPIFMLGLDFLGSSISCSVRQEEYDAVNEGDSIKVVGTPVGDFKLKKVRVQTADGAKGEGAGVFSRRKAA